MATASTLDSLDAQSCIPSGPTLVISHHTSTQDTLAMCPALVRSSQLASYSLGPIRKLRSPMRSSSRTRVAVKPSLQWALVIPMTYGKGKRLVRQVLVATTGWPTPKTANVTRVLGLGCSGPWCPSDLLSTQTCSGPRPSFSSLRSAELDEGATHPSLPKPRQASLLHGLVPPQQCTQPAV